MFSHPCYCSCPATDTGAADHISARRFASLSALKPVCFLTFELREEAVAGNQLNKWDEKLNLHRSLTSHLTLHPLTGLQLISSAAHPSTDMDTVLLLESFPIYWKTPSCRKLHFYVQA